MKKKTLMRPLGGLSRRKEKEERKAEQPVRPAFWSAEALKNCFCFSIEEEDREIYIEFAELLAEGAAYEMKEPQNMLDLLGRLEKARPDFAGINIPGTDVYLDRKRSEEGRGLLFRMDDAKGDFFSDATLEKMCFYDFYFDYLEISKKEKEENADNVRRFQPLKEVKQ